MNDNATIYYYDIGDYLTREQKLARIKEFGSIATMRDQFTILHPNKHGDWISHRDEGYEELIPLAPEQRGVSEHSVFKLNVIGTCTSRDAWVYNFSDQNLKCNVHSMIDFYNNECSRYQKCNPKPDVSDFVDVSPQKISWSRALRNSVKRNDTLSFDAQHIIRAHYRPYCHQWLYYDTALIESPGLNRKLFPANEVENVVICALGHGSSRAFSVFMSNCITDYQDHVQCFPLYWYEKNDQAQQMNLFDTGDEYTRRDGISDFILERVKELCGAKVTKQDIFYYVYGILHSEEYRAKYAVNLKKSLPRLPLPEDPKLFWAFSKAGAKLAELHLNYETLPPWKDLNEDSPKAKPSYRVTKMRFAKEGKEENKTAIIYNDEVTVWNIPLEAYDYVVNGKSAIEWIMERYAVTTHKESGIVNDPNLWCDEHNQPRYIIDLLKRIVTLSLETMKIVKALPKLGL